MFILCPKCRCIMFFEGSNTWYCPKCKDKNKEKYLENIENKLIFKKSNKGD